MINQETIQRIMDATQIEEVIGEFVSLHKRGANHIGCCPFHNEKTPSFYVSPSKGIFKCFGCGKSGNAVGFLMEHEHYTYPEALRYLAKKYNITIEEERLTDEQRERQTERDALFHVNEFAQKYFADLLYNNEMGSAVGLSYFHQRGLTDNIIKTFGLGYCLDIWSDFTDHARKNGYSDSVLEKTGLTIFRESDTSGQPNKHRKSYDRFRGRVMFPIYSISGRVLGFSGRILSKEKQAAKYVNSPDSEIYSKSHILYGLFQAKNAISRADKCYLVEGNVDVVSMHQSDVCNTVASCGTSLTVEQIRLIKRYTQNVTILYDGDSAGIKAALRAVNLLFEEGMHVRVVLFPDGEDPDSYAQKYGSTKLQEYLQNHEENFVDFKTRVMMEDVKKDPIQRAQVLQEIVNTIALVPDMLEQQGYVSQTAERFNVPEETLNQTLANTVARNKQKAWKEEQRQSSQNNPVNPNSPNNQESYEIPDFQIGTHVAPPQVLPDKYPAEAQERQIIQLLVNHGTKNVTLEFVDETGKLEYQQVNLAATVVEDLTTDELTFDNPVYQEIFDMYTWAVKKGSPLPDANMFVAYKNPEVKNMALQLMIVPYSLSNLWVEKKTILVPDLEDNLGTELTESLLSFKQKKLERQIAENQRKLKQCTNEDDINILMAEQVRLTNLHGEVCKHLHRVVT